MLFLTFFLGYPIICIQTLCTFLGIQRVLSGSSFRRSLLCFLSSFVVQFSRSVSLPLSRQPNQYITSFLSCQYLFHKKFSTFFRSSLCNILFFLPRSCGAFLYYHFCFHLSTVFLQFLIFFCSFVIFNNKNSRQLPLLCILQHLLCYFVLKTFESHIIDNKFTI